MIKNIKLQNFRIFDDLIVDTSASLIIISGKNATGKTSLLEAIYIASTSKSHRTNMLNTAIKNNCDFAVVEIDFIKKLKVVIYKEGKSCFINNSEVNKISDYIGNLHVVMSSPFDLSLIQGSKAVRRHFLDLELSLLDKEYLRQSSIYKRLLKERNEILKASSIDFKYLDVITKQMVQCLLYIYKARVKFLNDLNEILGDITSSMKIENIRLDYIKTYEDDIYLSFENKKKVDLANKVTTIGTHRDDFDIYINDLKANVYASEGQCRMICIAIKLALKEYIKNISKVEPILLLDDVFAALDQKRIVELTKYVLKSQQAFITTTSILEIPDELLKQALIIRMDNKKENRDGKQQ